MDGFLASALEDLGIWVLSGRFQFNISRVATDCFQNFWEDFYAGKKIWNSFKSLGVATFQCRNFQNQILGHQLDLNSPNGGYADTRPPLHQMRILNTKSLRVYFNSKRLLLMPYSEAPNKYQRRLDRLGVKLGLGNSKILDSTLTGFCPVHIRQFACGDLAYP